ncbi:MAG: hypothetical protein WBM08_14520 [Prochlorococcaceae cyanobacterium]
METNDPPPPIPMKLTHEITLSPGEKLTVKLQSSTTGHEATDRLSVIYFEANEDCDPQESVGISHANKDHDFILEYNFRPQFPPQPHPQAND